MCFLGDICQEKFPVMRPEAHSDGEVERGKNPLDESIGYPYQLVNSACPWKDKKGVHYPV